MPRYKHRGVRRYLTKAPKCKRHYGKNKVIRHVQGASCAVRDMAVADIASGENTIEGTHEQGSQGLFGQSDRLTGGVPAYEPFSGFESKVSLPGRKCRPIIVLSLYDGISSGLVALNKLGIPVLRYFSSEICPNALRVQSLRHPNVIRLGDVRQVTPEVLDRLGNIDLLLAASPCADLSRVNPRRAGLRGGTGVLYFEFIRILKYLQNKYKKQNHTVRWLFENTCHLDSSTLQQLTSDMGVPSKRCSSAFLPVTRKRFFWGNISGLEHETVVQKTRLTLQDCIDANKTAIISRARTLTSNRSGNFAVEYSGEREVLSPTDYERLQGNRHLHACCAQIPFHSSKELFCVVQV
ncbi:hypothetical protein FOCC_FOCC004387 [Frankliniella occidentalis]|nr:hypothetical protein FOCC_FOCC004387 [Frankliniella occidentalis]